MREDIMDIIPVDIMAVSSAVIAAEEEMEEVEVAMVEEETEAEVVPDWTGWST
jgi:hypothetical protein